MLLGLKSRWTMPASWAAINPRPASQRTLTTAFQSRGLAGCHFARVCPRTCSITMEKPPSNSSTSNAVLRHERRFTAATDQQLLAQDLHRVIERLASQSPSHRAAGLPEVQRVEVPQGGNVALDARAREIELGPPHIV
jgi:hypothetical protein